MKNKVFFFGFCIVLFLVTACGHHSPAKDPVTHIEQPDEYKEDQPDIKRLGEPNDESTVSVDEMFQEYSRQYIMEPWITRDDFAHILWHIFSDEYPRNRRPPVVTDIDRSLNRQTMLEAAAAGILPVGRDHRILPEARIRKQDAARSFYRIMELADALPDRSEIEAITRPFDISPAHMMNHQILACLAAGIMVVEQDNRFHAGRIVSGTELLKAVEALYDHISISIRQMDR